MALSAVRKTRPLAQIGEGKNPPFVTKSHYFSIGSGQYIRFVYYHVPRSIGPFKRSRCSSAS